MQHMIQEANPCPDPYVLLSGYLRSMMGRALLRYGSVGSWDLLWLEFLVGGEVVKWPAIQRKRHLYLGLVRYAVDQSSAAWWRFCHHEDIRIAQEVAAIGLLTWKDRQRQALTLSRMYHIDQDGRNEQTDVINFSKVCVESQRNAMD